VPTHGRQNEESAKASTTGERRSGMNRSRPRATARSGRRTIAKPLVTLSKSASSAATTAKKSVFPIAPTAETPRWFVVELEKSADQAAPAP
jgi:hypothetical protein